MIQIESVGRDVMENARTKRRQLLVQKLPDDSFPVPAELQIENSATYKVELER